MNIPFYAKIVLSTFLIWQCAVVEDSTAQFVPTNVTLQNTTLQRGTHLATQNITVNNVDEGVRTGEPISFKSMNYNALIPLLLKALQEQQAEIDALKEILGRN